MAATVFPSSFDAHVEGFDLGRIIGEDDRFFAVFFSQIPLVFRLEIGAPFDGKFKGFARFFQDLDGFGIGEMSKGGCGDVLEPFDESFFDEVVEKFQIFGAVFQDVVDA